MRAGSRVNKPRSIAALRFGLFRDIVYSMVFTKSAFQRATAMSGPFGPEITPTYHREQMTARRRILISVAALTFAVAGIMALRPTYETYRWDCLKVGDTFTGFCCISLEREPP